MREREREREKERERKKEIGRERERKQARERRRRGRFEILKILKFVFVKNILLLCPKSFLGGDEYIM